MSKPATSPFFSNRGQQLLVAVGILSRSWRGPSRGSQLLQGKDSARAIAERIGCSKSFAAYLMTGERTATLEWTRKIAEAYGIAEWVWCEPPWERDAATGEWRQVHPDYVDAGTTEDEAAPPPGELPKVTTRSRSRPRVRT